MADVEVDKILKRFGEFTAVDGISFEVGHGEVFGLLGAFGVIPIALIRCVYLIAKQRVGAALDPT